LVTTDDGRRILLDCGMFQGGRAAERSNANPFPFDPKSVDAVIISHAHIDHCGRLPLLVKAGFTGKIYCTYATADLLPVMLTDSGYIQEKEAEWQNRKNERAGRPLIEPLYTVKDADAVLKYVVPVNYDQIVKPLPETSPDIEFVLNDAGHILGSAIIELWAPDASGSKTKLVFSGDLGTPGRPLLRDPKLIKKADFVLMESTYGGRFHPPANTGVQRLTDTILRVTARGGNVVIPSFAVGRTQELLYELNKLCDENPAFKERMKSVSVYVDSPMATTATEVFRRNAQVFDDETRALLMKGDDPLDFEGLKFTRTSAESKLLNADTVPKVIISASGMCDAGRIRHHLKHNLWRKECAVVFVGYQAEGTLGRSIIEGAQTVTLFGEEITVNAEIINIEGFSGHADENGLLHWAAGFQMKPRAFFLVHGEAEAKEALARSMAEKLQIPAITINEQQEVDLSNTPHTTSLPQGVSNATQSKGGATTTQDSHTRQATTAAEEKYTPEEIERMWDRLSDVRNELETMLTGSKFAAKDLPPEKAAEMGNALIKLEKDTANLASAVATRG
jgi:metallo-beta-lactamase family protein